MRVMWLGLVMVMAAAAGPPLAEMKPASVVTLAGETYHVQGVEVEAGTALVTSVDREGRKGWLFEYDAATGARRRAVEIQQGAMYHPGGFDGDAGTVWIPVAEYRANSRSVIQRRDRKTFALVSSFEVEDHIGAVAAGPDRLYGANWDARKIYEWTFEGRLLRVRENPLGARYQDMKYRYGMLVAGGVAPRGSAEHAVYWLDPETLEARRVLAAGVTDRGTAMVNEGLDVRDGTVHVLPEDAPSRLFTFDTLEAASLNKADRLEWFRDLGFGMFIHWNVDVTLGSVISHSLAGADRGYVERYFRDLPRYLDAKKFDARDWARLAKLAGMRYVVFTTKHHSGFAWWATETTPFNVMNTPLKRDVVKEVVEAFRAEGIAIGFYISPDDFWWFHQNGVPIARPPAPRTTTRELPEMKRYVQRQIDELLTKYGPVDVLFIDGPAHGIREQAWLRQPSIVVTRGAIETPEQHVPGIPMDQPWEACITIGEAWQHKPADVLKSSKQLIETLVEIRAKGGNLLLNVGPRPDGEISQGEEGRLRDIALWHFVNGEALDAVRPWILTNEDNIWFTRHKSNGTVYAFVTRSPWKLGERRELVLKSVRATAGTKVSVLGQSDELLEYRPDVSPKTEWRQTSEGLVISAMTAQRMYDDRRWDKPVVLKITEAEAALKPPQVVTLEAAPGRMRGRVAAMGDVERLEAGFEYRPRKGLTDMYERTEPWLALPLRAVTGVGEFTAEWPAGVDPAAHEYRAVVKHPLLMLYGAERPGR